MSRIVYLHGFASSPQSSKAQFFRKRFEERGQTMVIPQLDGGDFPGLTITGQLRVVDQAVGNDPAILFGSSLGGYLAALFASRHPERVRKLVLLAPAFQFPSRWRARFSPEDLETWKQRGTLPIFHYGHKKEMGLGYQIVEDSSKYEEEPEFAQPALVFHGVQDAVVPAQMSQDFAKRHPNVQVQLFNSGHELTDVLEEMWMSTLAFLNSF
ncbi:MAG TPA: YqiA/YcfP family alpha/beta fold hydrolase [Bryobacteraceae bacterium]|jgi:hypothetical protein